MTAVWHGHHNILISWLESVEERREEIRQTKPAYQHAIRLRLMRPVQSELPEEKELATKYKAKVTALQAYYAAEQEYKTARQEYLTTEQAYDAVDAMLQAYYAAEQEYKVAHQEYLTTEQAYDAAEQEFERLYEKHLPQIETLHSAECVADCPWDGKSIFPER